MSIGQFMPEVLDRVMVTDQCWLWLGGRSTKGYGQIVRGGKHYQVHRIAFESVYGDIPNGMVVDHECHDPKVCVGGTCVHRLCVNPDHLSLATNAENVARQTPASKTHCKHGHPLSGENLALTKTGRRSCRTCRREHMERYRATPKTDTAKARAWARALDIPVNDRGRVSKAVLEAYRDSLTESGVAA